MALDEGCEMYLTGTKINNLKSFGTIDNYLKIDRRITAIIGVNESGKSNILELLGNIDFTKSFWQLKTYSIWMFSVPLLLIL